MQEEMTMTHGEFSEVVRVVELDTITVADGDDLRFRIEVLKRGRPPVYSTRVWRLEFYRIQPTFPQHDGQPSHEPCDEEILVRADDAIGDVTADSADAALAEALRRFEERF